MRVTLEPQTTAGRSAILPASLPASGAALSTLSDDSGAFRLDNVPPGLYLITFAGTAYAVRNIGDIRVESGSEIHIDSDLASLLSYRIRVSGRRADDDPGVSRTVLGREALEERPAALGDPFRALAGRAGIAPGNDFQSEMRIRGGDAGDTAVLLDGQPLPYAYHFGGAAGSAGSLNADLLDSVAASTGGFSAEHGEALAGVIDLATRDPGAGGFTGTVGIGSMLAHAALFGPAGSGSYAVSGRYGNLGAYDDHAARDGTDAVAFHDLYGAWRTPLHGGARLGVTWLSAANAYHATLGYADQAAMSSASRGLRGRLEIPLDPSTLLRVQAAASDLAVDSAVTGGMSFAQVQVRQDLRLAILRLAGDRHRLSAGLGLDRAGGRMSGILDPGEELAPADLHDRDDVASAFFEDTWRPVERLALRIGARGDRSGRTHESVLSPRLGLEIRPRERLLLRLSAGRFAQFPRQEQLFLAAGERLRVQIADQVTAGVEVVWRNGVELVVEGYRKDFTRPIGEAINRYVDLPEVVRQFDAGAATGGEITLRCCGRGASSWEMNYAWLSATQGAAGAVSPRNADQRQSLGLAWERRFGRGWETQAVFRYSSGLPYTPVQPWSNGFEFGIAAGDLNGARLPAYGRLDLGLRRIVPESWGRLVFRLDLVNVTNRANVRSVDVSFNPADGMFYRTTRYQSPFLPAFSLAAEF